MNTSTKTELAPIHDFSRKLRQEGLIDDVREYVRWQASRRGTIDTDIQMPERAPISINLDLTTVCNYACDHCVDMDILNTNFKFEHEKLMNSLQLMIDNGLKSVIIIGGGEPTTYPKFEEVVYFLKERGMKVAVVSNGSGNHRILKCADAFTKGDWVRLSLDSGSDEVFQAMHKPKKKLTLDSICEFVPQIKEKNPDLQMGFSFIIVWKGAEINETNIIENIDEIEMATERARRYKFDYISLKPFLSRSPVNNAEVIEVDKMEQEGLTFDEAMAKIRKSAEKAKEYETDVYKVWESTNLRVLENGTFRNYTKQPKMCHMQFFRQVLSPLGTFNCPVYRHQEHAQLGDKNSYEDSPTFKGTLNTTRHLLDTFNATKECKEVTCLYNHVNWWLEDLIENPNKLDELEASEDTGDYYL